MSWFRKIEPNKSKSVSTDSEWSNHLIKELDDSILMIVHEIKQDRERSEKNNAKMEQLYNQLRTIRIDREINT